MNRTLVTRGGTTINYEAIKNKFFDETQPQTTKRSTNSNMPDACTFYHFLPKQVPKYGIRRRLVAQIHTLPIYTSRSYDQGFHNALNEVSVPANKPRQQER